MARPTVTPRGLIAKAEYDVVGGDASKTITVITGNANGITLDRGLSVSGQTTLGLLTANSTAMILPNSVRVGTKTTYLSSDSTGVKLGSRYISTNTTGNTTT